MSVFDDLSDFSTMCRLCLSHNVELVNLYLKDEFNSTTSSSTIVEIIERFTTIKIHPSDHLPQKICECCIQTVKSMLAFQNKCRQNNEELQKRIRDRDETKNNITILAASDTKEIFEVVNVVESDRKENLRKVDVHKTEEFSDESDAKEMFELFNVDESDTKEILEEVDVQKSEPKEIVMMNADPDLSSDEDNANVENSTRPTQRVVKNDLRSRRYPKCRLEGTIACHICGKRYHNFKMRYHINMHEGLRPFACDIDNCTSNFAAPYELKTHKRECHFKKAEWICDVCGRAFKRKTALRIHLSYHFDPKIPCTICNKLFKNNRALTKHMLVHSQERKFKCDICQKSYQTRYTLRIHKRVHTQEKPYSCHCGVSFAYNCLLKAHTEKYHKEKATKSA